MRAPAGVLPAVTAVTAGGNQVVVQYPYQFRSLAIINGFFGNAAPG